VTIKTWSFDLVTGFIGHLKFLIHCGAVTNSHSLPFTTLCTKSSLSVVSSPVLWNRLPMADVPLPWFRNCSRASATVTLHSQCTQLEFHCTHLRLPMSSPCWAVLQLPSFVPGCIFQYSVICYVLKCHLVQVQV
jgi:hypothetical protein